MILYSACYGSYDHPRPLPEIPGVECLMFTDDPELVAPGWEVRVSPPPEDEHPRISAKRFKILPHLMVSDTEQTIWADAAHTILSPDIVRAVDYLGDVGIALHRHPSRVCIYDEADASMPMIKYQGSRIPEQVAFYRSQGHPERWGLWECGSIVSDRSHDEIFEAWWAEINEWSYQDQISLPWVMRNAGMRPQEFPTDQYSSPWVRPGGHRRDD